MATQSIEKYYDQLSAEFFDLYYTYHPVHATRQGLHQYDNNLGHYYRNEIQETLRRMKLVQSQVISIDPQMMDEKHALDYPVLITRMKREIYWIEEWRFWENNPLFYKDIITEGMFNIVSRDYAPLPERLKALISRQKDIPKVFAAARENLTNPPKVYTELAIRYFPAVRNLFVELPKEFESCSGSELFEEFQKTNHQAILEVDVFAKFLENDLLPRSNGNFAVGEGGIQKILDVEEMIDVPVRRILDRLYADLKKTEDDLENLGHSIDPKAQEKDLLEMMWSNHPDLENLIETVETAIHELRQNLIDYDLVTIPSDMPDVHLTSIPGYAGASGMMLTPGPFETHAKESYLAINLPKSDWSKDKLDRQLKEFNPYALRLLLAHEGYPGHHVQFYLEKRVPMFASKDHDSDSNSDGWAEYGKYMQVSEIYGKTDPLYNYAVLRDKRGMIVCAIAGIEIHMGLKNLEEAAQLLVEKSGRSLENSLRVLDRAIYYPTHLTYYIGGEMMRKLRDDYRLMKGDQFLLREFNDHFLTYGLIPIKVIRKAMLGNFDDGVLF